ncbi:MAG TPA: hypothetical protein VFA68_21360 [Terriglobales bacterium]|nr:hypothetical protein [Terriglobales bacterium]
MDGKPFFVDAVVLISEQRGSSGRVCRGPACSLERLAGGVYSGNRTLAVQTTHPELLFDAGHACSYNDLIHTQKDSSEAGREKLKAARVPWLESVVGKIWVRRSVIG